MKTLTIASRFCGPPTSANGGYFAGLVASLAPKTVSVRLRKPPPLETEFAVTQLPDGALQVHFGEELVGDAVPATLSLDPPSPPEYLGALEASRHYAGLRYHRFPTCFVCGTQRARGDGLRIFAGPVEGRQIPGGPLGTGCIAGCGRWQGACGVHVSRTRLPRLLRGGPG